MGRETATYVKCDGPSCKEIAKVLENGEAPANWYLLQFSREKADHNTFQYDRNSAWEFHSLKCLGKFSRARAEALAPKVTRSSGKSNTAKGKIKEVFLIDPNASLTIPEIAELAEIEKSWAYKNVNEMVMAGDIFQIREAGERTAKYRLTPIGIVNT